MDGFVSSLAQHSGAVLLVLAGTVLLLMVLLAVLAVNLKKRHGKWAELLQGTRGESLETLLYDHLRSKMRLEAELVNLTSRIQTLESELKRSKRHLGLVRYDAFTDVGGQQSFALALCDDEGDGTLVTSVVGRNDCRVYAKPVKAGQAGRSLSEDEIAALRSAMSGAATQNGREVTA
jgi:hypothetical protein